MVNVRKLRIYFAPDVVYEVPIKVIEEHMILHLKHKYRFTDKDLLTMSVLNYSNYIFWAEEHMGWEELKYYATKINMTKPISYENFFTDCAKEIV